MRETDLSIRQPPPHPLPPRIRDHGPAVGDLQPRVRGVGHIVDCSWVGGGDAEGREQSRLQRVRIRILGWMLLV